MIKSSETCIPQIIEIIECVPTISESTRRTWMAKLSGEPDPEAVASIVRELDILLGQNIQESDDLNDIDSELAEMSRELESRQISETSLALHDSIPEGGLDPRLVFEQPPSALQNRPADPPPKDCGPPPPPPGHPILEESGFDSEDLRVLALVGDYRFGSILSQLATAPIVIAEHPETEFDEDDFIAKLRNSISLNMTEKFNIIAAIPKLSQFQVSSLLDILTEEFTKFSNMSPKHLHQLRKMEVKFANEWMMLVGRFR